MSQCFIKQEVKNLKKKAEQNRQMHFSISKTASLLNKILHAVALIGSSITAILTFAEFSTFLPWFPWLTDETYKLIIGFFAGLIFIITILEEYLGLGKKAATHEAIGKQLTTFIRTTSILETYETLTQAELDQVSGEYSSINESAPIIPDRIFIREKQRLQVKIDISKKLEKTPHMSVPLYCIKMKLKQLFSSDETQN
ncbi:SLATT domain-containing protein [Peribacillus frigoritolerans]|uniref:SLATT domain-containing protein n=1 Tax=Peribacillus frigoritolerans TaxID=450367 RepID=UPI002E9AD63E|nr:SLATT domain-containing protein [Peribacillus frigoritolerans]